MQIRISIYQINEHLHVPQCTADMTSLQGPLPKVSTDIVSQPCTFLILQPPFLQLLLLWTIEAKLRAQKFSAATFSIRLCIAAAVKMK